MPSFISTKIATPSPAPELQNGREPAALEINQYNSEGLDCIREQSYVLAHYPKEPEDRRYVVHTTTAIQESWGDNTDWSIDNFKSEKFCPPEHRARIEAHIGESGLQGFRTGLKVYHTNSYWGGQRMLWILCWGDEKLRCNKTTAREISTKLQINSFFELMDSQPETNVEMGGVHTALATNLVADCSNTAGTTLSHSNGSVPSQEPALSYPVLKPVNIPVPNSNLLPPPLQSGHYTQQSPVQVHNMQDGTTQFTTQRQAPQHTPCAPYQHTQQANMMPSVANLATPPTFTYPVPPIPSHDQPLPSIEQPTVGVYARSLPSPVPSPKLPEITLETHSAGAVVEVHAKNLPRELQQSIFIPKPTQCIIYIPSQRGWTTAKYGLLEALAKKGRIFLAHQDDREGFNSEVDTTIWKKFRNAWETDDYKVVGLGLKTSTRNKYWFQVTVLIEPGETYREDVQELRKLLGSECRGPMRVSRTEFNKSRDALLESEANRTPAGRNFLEYLANPSSEDNNGMQERESMTPEAELMRALRESMTPEAELMRVPREADTQESHPRSEVTKRDAALCRMFVQLMRTP